MTIWLESVAWLVAIASAFIAVIRFALRAYKRVQLRKRIEGLLAKKTAMNDDSLTLAELVAATGHTEDEIVVAMKSSHVAEPWIGQSGNERRYRTKPRSNSAA